MSQPETGFGKHHADDNIRDVLREYASREKPLGQSAIVKYLKERGINRDRTAVRGFADRMGAREYVTEEECDEIIKECRVDERGKAIPNILIRREITGKIGVLYAKMEISLYVEAIFLVSLMKCFWNIWVALL